MKKVTHKVVSLLVVAGFASTFHVGAGGCWVAGEELCLAAGYCVSQESVGLCYPEGSEGPVQNQYCPFFTAENVNRPKVQQTPPGYSGHVGVQTFTSQDIVSVTERILNSDCTYTDIPNYGTVEVQCEGATAPDPDSDVCYSV